MSPTLVKVDGVYRATTHKLEDLVVVDYDPKRTNPDALAEYLAAELGLRAEPQRVQ